MRFLLFGFFCLGCGGQTLASGSDASSDASPTQDAASDSSIPDASFRSSLSFGNGASGGSFFGEFFATAQQVNGCQTTTMGACVVAVCPNVGPQTLPSAGTLTISIGSSALTVTQQNGYYVHTPISFAPGDVLGVSASGGDVPAFATQTITSPGKIVVSPALPSTIVTSQDLTMTWSGGESGASVVIAMARAQNNGSTDISCSFDATAGTGTIPKAQLASLQAGAPTGELSIGQTRQTTFASGTFVIDLAAMQYEEAQITFQ